MSPHGAEGSLRVRLRGGLPARRRLRRRRGDRRCIVFLHALNRYWVSHLRRTNGTTSTQPATSATSRVRSPRERGLRRSARTSWCRIRGRRRQNDRRLMARISLAARRLEARCRTVTAGRPRVPDASSTAACARMEQRHPAPRAAGERPPARTLAWIDFHGARSARSRREIYYLGAANPATSPAPRPGGGGRDVVPRRPSTSAPLDRRQLQRRARRVPGRRTPASRSSTARCRS